MLLRTVFSMSIEAKSSLSYSFSLRSSGETIGVVVVEAIEKLRSRSSGP